MLTRSYAISLMRTYLDIFILDAAIAYAQAASCFDYARRVRGTVPPRLSWADVDTAMMAQSTRAGIWWDYWANTAL